MSSTQQTKPNFITSGWFTFFAQLMLVVFWGAYHHFQLQETKTRFDEYIKQNIPTRMSVAETRLDHYDKMLGDIDDMKDDVGKMQIDISSLSTQIKILLENKRHIQ